MAMPTTLPSAAPAALSPLHVAAALAAMPKVSAPVLASTLAAQNHPAAVKPMGPLTTITPDKNLGSAFASMPRLLGTAMGQEQGMQAAYQNAMKLMPTMMSAARLAQNAYEWAHLSPYQSGSLNLRQQSNNIQAARLPIEQQVANADMSRAGTAAGQLNFDVNKWAQQYKLDEKKYGLQSAQVQTDLLKAAATIAQNAYDANAKNTQLVLDQYHYANPWGTMPGAPTATIPQVTLPQAPDYNAIIQQLQAIAGSIGSSQPSTGATGASPGNTTSRGTKAPAGSLGTIQLPGTKGSTGSKKGSGGSSFVDQLNQAVNGG